MLFWVGCRWLECQFPYFISFDARCANKIQRHIQIGSVIHRGNQQCNQVNSMSIRNKQHYSFRHRMNTEKCKFLHETVRLNIEIRWIFKLKGFLWYFTYIHKNTFMQIRKAVSGEFGFFFCENFLCWYQSPMMMIIISFFSTWAVNGHGRKTIMFEFRNLQKEKRVK